MLYPKIMWLLVFGMHVAIEELFPFTFTACTSTLKYMYMHVCMHYSRAFLFFNLSIFCLNNTLILHFSGCYIMQLCNTDVIAEYNTMKLLSYRYQTKLFIQRGTNMFWKNYASQLRNTCTCNI